MSIYPELGETINFIRTDVEKQKAVEGSGMVQAILLDPSNRRMVQVKCDDGKVWNIDLFAVNPSATKIRIYKKMVDDINTITKEGNEAVQRAVTEYTKKVDDIYNAVLGEAVELKEVA